MNIFTIYSFTIYYLFRICLILNIFCSMDGIRGSYEYIYYLFIYYLLFIPHMFVSKQLLFHGRNKGLL
jgi:hypothetical protein